MRASLAMSLLCVWSVVARAAPAAPLPRRMRLVVEDAKLFVERGTQKAPLSTGSPEIVQGIDDVVVDAATGKVAFDVQLCNPTVHLETTLDALEARLANVEGLALHRKKRYAKAAARFRRAVALDPAFDLAAENLASALALGGQPDQAVDVLGPWITANPTWLYGRVATDPELASIRAQRAIAAMRAPKRGNVVIEDGAIVGGVAWSSARGELAAVHRESSWGSCNWFADVVVYDAATHALRATFPLVEWRDTADDCAAGNDGILPTRAKMVAGRAAAIQGVLRDLGFSAAAVEGERGDRADGARVTRFPALRLVWVDDGGKSTALTGDAALAGDLQRRERAWLVPDAKQIVVEWSSAGSEGCSSTDPTGLDFVPIPSP